MVQQISCSDSECTFYDNGICIAGTVAHTSDRFCTTGRRKQIDNITKLMQATVGICKRKGGSMQRRGGATLK